MPVFDPKAPRVQIARGTIDYAQRMERKSMAKDKSLKANKKESENKKKVVK